MLRDIFADISSSIFAAGYLLPRETWLYFKIAITQASPRGQCIDDVGILH